MKKLKLISLGILLSLSSCSDASQENDLKSVGTITGQDFRMCLCCRGWFIEVNNESYRFSDLPDKSSINLVSEELPIEVYVDWTLDQNSCLGDEIIIERIEKIILSN
ncbi:MAG: hypothetical protein GY816_23480 [Cytophagales bacterium]|nr:hypothetical protein [Cytophagales bacterium]